MGLALKRLRTGVFQGNLKIGQLTPLFKTGDPKNACNYRPISALPCFSNVLERMIYNRLHKYLIKA